jgi:hypothetical protein
MRAKDLIQAVSRMRPDLQREYLTAVSRGLLAATFANVVLGPFIRRVILYWAMGDDEGSNVSIVASSVEVRYEKHHPRRAPAHAA